MTRRPLALVLAVAVLAGACTEEPRLVDLTGGRRVNPATNLLRWTRRCDGACSGEQEVELVTVDGAWRLHRRRTVRMLNEGERHEIAVHLTAVLGGPDHLAFEERAEGYFVAVNDGTSDHLAFTVPGEDGKPDQPHDIDVKELLDDNLWRDAPDRKRRDHVLALHRLLVA